MTCPTTIWNIDPVMNELNELIKNVVGKSKVFNKDPHEVSLRLYKKVDGEFVLRVGYEDWLEVVENCKKHFDYYIMERKYKTREVVDNHFVVKDEDGDFVGVFNIPETQCGDMVNLFYSDRFCSEEDFHKFNKNYENVVYYEKQK